jgi:methylated-DNA-[protein]-cysteine S-methyltransferase
LKLDRTQLIRQVAVPLLLKRTIRKALSGKTFSVPPLDLNAFSDFQKKVFKATSTIPWGQTQSYAWIAQKIDQPRASRAVGGALHANPLPIFIPCHRVIASRGALGGFNAGLKWKRLLLKLESSSRI